MKALGFQVPYELGFYQNIHQMGVVRGVQLTQLCQRMVHIDDLIETTTKQFLLTVVFFEGRFHSNLSKLIARF